MRKNVFGKQFKRDKNERTALFKGLLSALVLKEKITTTEIKAKAIKADADKLITKIKKNGSNARYFVQPLLIPEAVDKLINDTGLRFVNRQGGYTRITRLGRRFSDNASMVVLEWTEQASVKLKVQNEKVEKKISEKPKAESMPKKSFVAKKIRSTKKTK